ncbi:hypothetical protein RYX36_006040 [Vicia faba]
MAKYSKNVLVFCIGMLLVSLWCMKVNGRKPVDAPGNLLTGQTNGHEDAPVGCNSKQSGAECTDDTFKTTTKRTGGGGRDNKGEKHENPFSGWFGNN